VISQNRYIKIVSGVGAANVVAQRQLIMRIITQNPVIPPGIVIEFSTADAVGAYFGTSSEEYLRAVAYFRFVSKSITSPSLLSFARWVNQAIAPTIVGDSFAKNITSFAGVTAGTLTINVGNAAVNISAIDLSQAANLTAVATAIQVKLRATADPQLTAATVTYNTNTNQFTVVGTITGSGVMTVTPTGLATDISQITGLATGSTVIVSGQAADTAAVAVAKSASISNNMGSFIFTTPLTPLANTDIVAIATWNDLQNNMYIYSLATSAQNMGTLFPLVKGLSGCALNLMSSTALNDYVEQSPCEILAATNFNAPNGSQNYMFYQFPSRNITVSDDTMADTMDKLRANYIGVTQSAGQPLAFYQRGLLCGGSTAAVDMNVYANEMWLKSAIGATSLALLIALPTVPANPTGGAMFLGVYQPILTLAGNNGTFSPGKTITAVQQQYITQVTGDSNAWRQVQTIGYWIDVSFSSYTNNNTGLTEWQATYKLVYSKGDAIRFVSGQDIMI
jgi:hypothetical protein